MALNSVDSYIASQPEEVMNFNDFYNEYGRQAHNGHWTDANPDNIFAKISNWFTGDIDAARNAYDAYLKNTGNRNEFNAVQSARAFDKMMDDTKYQRMMKDFEAAGLNPYLLINNNGISASSVPSSSKASYDYSSKDRKSGNGNGGRNFALILLALARIAAAFM